MKKHLFTFILLFLYSLPIFAKIVVISDLDDTLKQANSMGKPAEFAYHFLKKVPYYEMRDLFNELKSDARQRDEEIKFHYVSAAPALIFDAQAWISKHHFPAGPSYLKTSKTKAPTYDFKHKTIQTILIEEQKKLSPDEPLTVLMFGDNAQVDANVYSDLTKEMNLNSKIFIRDVRAEATFFDSTLPVNKLPGVDYYFSEVELFDLPVFAFISNALKEKTLAAYRNESLIPTYTLKTLERRLESNGLDKCQAKDLAQKYWEDYYRRF